MDIKILLYELRDNKNYSLNSLAKLSGVSRSHLNYIENGDRNPTINVLCSLCKVLDVELDDMVKYE